MSISTRLRNIQGRSGWLSCYVAGAVMALVFAPTDFWPLLFLCLPAFFLMLDASVSARQAMARSFAFGLGHFMAGTWWIANALTVDMAKFGWLIPFSVIGISALLALYFVLFGYLYHRLKTGCKLISLARFVALWVGIEYLRSIGIFGFPWNLAGYAALASLPVAQAASLVGVFGLSLLVVTAGVLPVLALEGTKPLRILGLVLPVVMIVSCYAYGASRLQARTEFTETTLRIVQPSIPQSIKGGERWLEESMAVMHAIERDHPAPVDITVWPETAYPVSIRGNRTPTTLPNTLLTGAVRIEGENRASFRIYNSIVAIDPQGLLLMAYDKHQLVPFGEFVPLRSVLPLEKITPGNVDFSRGNGPQTILLRDLPSFSPLVCYEAIFPWMAADPAHRPQWLVNATNDAWYGDSPGPYQHLAAARMRAIEQGLPLVRAANSGISAVIDPYGRIVEQLTLNRRDVIESRLPKASAITPYGKLHEWPIVLLLALGFGVTVMAQRIKKNK